MKVVILCGGRGTRLHEETEVRPKPMLPIGNRPILWHIMKIYAHYGYKEFILCLGYKGEVIREYFRNYLWNTHDIVLGLGPSSAVEFYKNGNSEDLDWKIILAETGLESMTAYRVQLINKYLGDDDTFLLTYGDGVGNIDISALLQFHKKMGKVCTLTGVHPSGRFGDLGIQDGGIVTEFNEKPQAEGGYINGGFMVCSRKLFDYLSDDPIVMLEQEPMRRLVQDEQLAVYCHEGFWQPMDTYSEFRLLNELWASGKALWKVWD